MEKMTLEDMIKEYGICYTNNHNGKEGIYIRDIERAKKDLVFDTIKAKKYEIRAIFIKKTEEEKRARKERQEKIEAIEGLDEILKLQAAWEKYRRDFNAMMDSEYNDGVCSPMMPKVKVDTLLTKYPRAAAYLKAESYSYSPNYTKAAAGERAMDCIINGDDYKEAINKMDEEWSSYCDSHILD